jgi:hypothetical protein
MLGFYMKRFLSVCALLLTFSFALQAQDQDRLIQRTRISKQSATLTGDRGSFTVSSSETLNRGQFSFGAAWNNFDRTPKDIDINSFPVYGSIGLFSRLSVSAMVEVHKEIVANNLSQGGFNSALPFVTTHYQKGVGDSIISVKYKLQRKRDNVGGIALKGFVKVPSGDAAKGLSTGKTDVGAELLFSSLLPLNFMMHSSLGYVSTSDATSPAGASAVPGALPTGTPRNVRDEMRSGIAALWPSSGIGNGNVELQGVFEYTTQTFVGCCSSQNFAVAKTQNANDLTGGIRLLVLNAGLSFDAGYRINRTFDETDPNNSDRRGFFGGISYTKPNAAGSSTNRGPLVSVESDVTEITGAGTANLTATGFDADGDTLSYTWTATGGQVVGNGARATYRSGGAAAGRYTIRVLTSDNRGGTANAEIEITVR